MYTAVEVEGTHVVQLWEYDIKDALSGRFEWTGRPEWV